MALRDFCSVLECSFLPLHLPYPLYWHGCLYSCPLNIRAEKCGQKMVFQLPVLNYQLYKFPNPVNCSVTKTLQFMPSEILNQQKRLARDSNFLFSGNADASNAKCWSSLLTIIPELIGYSYLKIMSINSVFFYV